MSTASPTIVSSIEQFGSLPQRHPDDALDTVTDDVARLRTWIVNLYYLALPSLRNEFVLIDTGMPFWADEIAEHAQRRFGSNARCRAIILTHGHFDHIGNVRKLADLWDVPVYAHELELPYLTAQSDYPPPDPTVGGGMMARTSFLLPKKGIDLGDRVEALPVDSTVPYLPDWRWIHTPGHSPGHVSFFRDSDKTLIAGDAFITQRQESLAGAITEKMEMHGPPMYFTQDWIAAWSSVQRLADLEPETAATGHGRVMRGIELRMALNWLADHFDEAAIPRDGRYVREPALADESGTFYVPPPVPDPVTKIMVGGAAIAAGALAYKLLKRRDRHNN
jgi:glyoxylase-like metal-dependent hydrolase (beta-lactamase superfamily II)